MGPDSLPDLSILKLDDDNYSAPSSAAQSVIFSVSGYGQAAGEAGSVCTRATSLFSLSEDDEDDHGDVNDNDEEPHMLPLTHEPLDPLDDRIRQVLDVPVGWLIDQLGEDLESVILSSRSGRRAKFLRPKSDTSKDLKLGRTTRRVDAEADRAASADPELPFIVGSEGEKRPIQAVRRDDSARLRIQLTGHTGIEALEARFDPHGGRAAREEILRSLRERDTADGRRHSEGFEVIDTETSWKLGSVEVWVRPMVRWFCGSPLKRI